MIKLIEDVFAVLTVAVLISHFWQLSLLRVAGHSIDIMEFGSKTYLQSIFQCAVCSVQYDLCSLKSAACNAQCVALNV